MELITIAVDSAIAKAYREASPREQEEIQSLVNIWLQQAMKRRSLDTIIHDMQVQANATGLTQNILNQLLADE